MALDLSGSKGSFQMVNLKMENVASQLKKTNKPTPLPVHVKPEDKKTQTSKINWIKLNAVKC